MNAILNQKKFSSIIIALITIVIGVLLLIYGKEIALVLLRIAGAVLAVIGAYYIIAFIATKAGRVFGTWMSMGAGVLCFLIGLWMIISPGTVIVYMQFVVAFVIIVHGLLDLQAAFSVRKYEGGKWGWILLMGLVTIALGVWILLEPMDATKTLMTLIGIFLIIDGLTDLAIILRISQVVRCVRKTVEEEKQAFEAIETEGTVDGQAFDAEGAPVEESTAEPSDPE